MTATERPYAHAAEEWREAGWSPLPLPARAKKSPPEGYTGADGIEADAEQVATWIEQRPDSNIGLRMPLGVIGIDVDAYKTAGMESWVELQAKCGQLPDTYTLTSRTDGVSGIRLFSVPPTVKLKGAPKPGIEIIQHHHRYAVAWPSIHPSGNLYRLIGPDGDDNCQLPHPADLPDLPGTWLAELTEKPRPAGTAAPRATTGDWSKAVTAVYAEAMAGMVKGSRHDTALAAVAGLARLELQDHPGATDAIESIGSHFRDAILDRPCSEAHALKEWNDIVDGARMLVRSTSSYRDPYPDLKAGSNPVTQLLVNGTKPQVNRDTEAQGEVETDDLSGFLDPDIDDFLSGDDPPYDWVIPDVAESGDRIIVTGEEGRGKSTLLRQIAVQVAAGVHPFTGEPMLPIRALIIDCENSRRQVRRKIRPLRELTDDLEPGNLRINIVGHALDLAKPPVYEAIALRVRAFLPHLIVIGPLYKMTDGDPTKEEPAKALADALDALRGICGSALLIEAHTPYADGSKAKRPIRPYGASLWSRWPEFGIFLDADGQLEHWRGPRDERAWPSKLRRSEPWPWAVQRATAPDDWDGPTRCMEALEVWFKQRPGESFSRRQMYAELRAAGLSYRDDTVDDALNHLADAGTLHWRKGPRRADLYSYQPPIDLVDNRAF